MGKIRNLKSTSVVSSSRTAAAFSMPLTNQESLRKLIQFEGLCGGDRDDDDGDWDDGNDGG